MGKMNASNLIAKVWGYANILRDSGVSYTDYVAQLSYLLFLKMEDEIASINPNANSMIPAEFRWGILVNVWQVNDLWRLAQKRFWREIRAI